MSDSENSDSETAEEQYPEEEEEEEELYSDDDFWDVSESDEENDELSSDSDNKGKTIQTIQQTWILIKNHCWKMRFKNKSVWFLLLLEFNLIDNAIDHELGIET